MPQKKRTNPFMQFTYSWKEQYGRKMSLQEAIEHCGKIWKEMDAQEREPYVAMARQARRKRNGAMECVGEPCTQLEKQSDEIADSELNMLYTIRAMVSNSLSHNQLPLQKYYFVMVNYFAKSLREDYYIPAEIAVSEFSIEKGITRVFWTCLNPKNARQHMCGNAHEAQAHSEATHKLPLPPDAKGEMDMAAVLNKIVKFIDPNNELNELPPLFTHSSHLDIVKSSLAYMADFSDSDNRAPVPTFAIYNIQLLLHLLKEAVCGVGDIETKPESQLVTDAFFEKDSFEYTPDLACDYHKKEDVSKYCAKSCVKRWGLIFSDYLCGDLAITPKPGHHGAKKMKINTMGMSSANMSHAGESTKQPSKGKLCNHDHVNSCVSTEKPQQLNSTRHTGDTFQQCQYSSVINFGSASGGYHVDSNEFPALGSNPQRKRQRNSTQSSAAGTNPWSNSGMQLTELHLDKSIEAGVQQRVPSKLGRSLVETNVISETNKNMDLPANTRSELRSSKGKRNAWKTFSLGSVSGGGPRKK